MKIFSYLVISFRRRLADNVHVSTTVTSVDSLDSRAIRGLLNHRLIGTSYIGGKV